MKNRPATAKNLAYLIMLFAVTSFACSISTTSSNTKATVQALEATSQALQVQQTNVAAVKTETPTATSATPKEVVLGKEYESVEGGFTFQRIPDYLLDELETAFVVMSAEDADPDIGPLLIVYSGFSDSNLTIHQNLEAVSQDFAGNNDLEFTGKKQINVDGNSGLAVDVRGEIDGEVIGGRIILVKTDPTRQFVMAGLAPETRWEELDLLVEAVIESVTLHELPTPEPIIVATEKKPQPKEIKLGKKYECDEGYFAFQKAPDYVVEVEGGLMTMKAEDADPDYGPMLVAINDKLSSENTLDSGLDVVSEMFLAEYELDFSDKDQIVIDGKKGISVDFDSEMDGENIKGRIALVITSSTRQFLLLGLAHENRWEELDPIFDAVLDSVTFMDEPVEEPLCGNGTCDNFENSGNCPQDCKSKVTCGDGICEPYVETQSSCPKDCGSVTKPLCGNGVCGDFENPGNCPQDCGSESEPLCGNGVCGDFENAGNCPQDCAPNEPLCGNGVCGDFENPGNCPQDCGTGDLCGDGICEPYMETSSNCPQDCGG